MPEKKSVQPESSLGCSSLDVLPKLQIQLTNSSSGQSNRQWHLDIVNTLIVKPNLLPFLSAIFSILFWVVDSIIDTFFLKKVIQYLKLYFYPGQSSYG